MKLFARIFLSFWLATVFAIAISVSSVMFLDINIGPEVSRSVPAEELDRYAKETIQRYFRGEKSLSEGTIQGYRIDFIVDASGRDINFRKLPHNLRNLVGRAETTGFMQVMPLPGLTLVVIPVQEAVNSPMAVVFSMRSWNRNPVSALFLQVIPFATAAALICYLLTGYILKPLKHLSLVAEVLGAGDLASRAVGNLPRRRDEFGELSRTFNRMADSIQSLVMSQRMFLAHISHELGSPITRLNLTLALARRKAPVEISPELDRIERETTELNLLVQQLLLLARLQSGNEFSSEPSPFQISDVIRDVVENAEFEANEVNRKVKITREEDFQVLGHRDLLKRALDNVIRNAVRFTANGSTVEIEFFTTGVQGSGLVNVRDSGPGVDPSQVDSIFEPFSTSGVSGGHSGVGLGLAIARQAVLTHRGTIAAENLSQGGLMITIQLPLHSNGTFVYTNA
jgi:two-component system sensor histidine kinase CpxA